MQQQVSQSLVTIERGTCYVLFAYDVALAINLDQVEQQLSALRQRDTIKHKHPAPASFEYRPAPIRVTQSAEPLAFGDYHSNPSVDLVLYDFGAVSVLYSIPLYGPFAGLVTLSEELYDNAVLLADSRRRVEQLVAAMRHAAVNVEISALVEDYVIFQLVSWQPSCPPQELKAAHEPEIARMLRAERQPLSQQEVADALAYQLSYGLDDLAVIDWHAILLCDSQGDDVRSVLEFANVELLEMRFLDRRLDDALNRSYAALSRRLWGPLRVFGAYRTDLRRVAQLQVENALLFEGVNNALKLIGDQYLARVYRLVSQRFHLAEWDESILRKLQTLESIYEKMTDQATTRRMEVLEWIIIILIAVSMVLPFVFGTSGH